MRRAARFILVSVACCFLGCAAAVQMTAQLGAAVGESTGALSGDQAEAIRKSAAPLAKSFEDITPEQEYYIGRAVGAQVASKYPAWKNEAANRYVSVLGTALSLGSDRPETFGGYHFQVLDTEEVNAFAAPGGFVFVTRGLLRLCRSESEAAAVLAHEIAHVELGHGLKAIKQSRLTSALTLLAVEGAKSAGNRQLAEVTSAFEGSIEDITRTLFEKGYSRGQEYDADAAAARILADTGYGPAGLFEVLRQMRDRMPQKGPGFVSTHPGAGDRLDELAGKADPKAEDRPNDARRARFKAALAAL